MAIPDLPLTILAFPQRWKDNALTVRFLTLPKGDPREPLQVGLLPFAQANLVFEAIGIQGTEHLPRSADATSLGQIAVDDPPANKAAVVDAFAAQFNIEDPVRIARATPRFRKVAPDSYRRATGYRQLSDYIAGDDAFACDMHAAHASQPEQPEGVPDTVTWGRLIAFALRQENLAKALGLLSEATFTPTAGFYDAGGWLYVQLHSTSDYAATPVVASFAARIPSLGGDRPLYTPVLFPVDGQAVADDVIVEVERYDNGFARFVHGAQNIDGGDAIQLGWDDEQVATWLNRQVDPALETPMGTSGYRVDVRRAGDADWKSLHQIASIGDLSVGDEPLGRFDGEAAIEVLPSASDPSRPHEFWMPAYFAAWRGDSLALPGRALALMQEAADFSRPESAQYLGYRLDREQSFVPVDDEVPGLVYGTEYDFRVRLVDLSGGGPEPTDEEPAAADARTTVTFQRRRRPGPVQVLKRPAPDDPVLVIEKPRLGFPDALFTGRVTLAQLEADFSAEPGREMGVHDPDVVEVEITADLRTLAGDTVHYLPLYTTTRAFVADEMILTLARDDRSDFSNYAPAVDGDLDVPTCRDVRLTLTPIGRDDAGYFAPADAALGPEGDRRRGESIVVDVRASALEQAALVEPATEPLRSFFFQPTPEDGSVAPPAGRLAQELGLDHREVTIAGRAGARTVFAASAGFRHTLSPERGSLTFASNAELAGRWINVIRFTVTRDWTWDGLTEEGISITRQFGAAAPGEQPSLIGTVRLPRALTPSATTGVPGDVTTAARQQTQVVFIDAFDPKPAPGTHPSEITVHYDINAVYKDPVESPAPVTLDTKLPVTTRPAQVPRLVSAGVALSPYDAADDYSSSAPRRRQLWLEFEAAPDDPDDQYFVRVLATAPDPMLIHGAEHIPTVVEPSLPIDPEWMRSISPNQPEDENGLEAMTVLDEASGSRRQDLVPLPEGLDEESPELFGMFTYEIRLGHAGSRWSTAQGRFGSPLRVAGVQHPVPTLTCHTARTAEYALIRAPFATPVYQGRNVRSLFPKTVLWGLVYARVRQADGDAWRNVLVARKELAPPRGPDGIHFIPHPEMDARTSFGTGGIPLQDLHARLERLGLPHDSPLTALAIEVLTDPEGQDPVGFHLGYARTLRTSPLVSIPPAC